jgi:hypothetical protein
MEEHITNTDEAKKILMNQICTTCTGEKYCLRETSRITCHNWKKCDEFDNSKSINNLKAAVYDLLEEARI